MPPERHKEPLPLLHGCAFFAFMKADASPMCSAESDLRAYALFAGFSPD
jgi:hypothetical protein